MDKLGEEYAKRLLQRRHTYNNRSPDFYLRTVQRRLNVLGSVKNESQNDLNSSDKLIKEFSNEITRTSSRKESLIPKNNDRFNINNKRESNIPTSIDSENLSDTASSQSVDKNSLTSTNNNDNNSWQENGSFEFNNNNNNNDIEIEFSQRSAYPLSMTYNETGAKVIEIIEPKINLTDDDTKTITTTIIQNKRLSIDTNIELDDTIKLNNEIQNIDNEIKTLNFIQSPNDLIKKIQETPLQSYNENFLDYHSFATECTSKKLFKVNSIDLKSEISDISNTMNTEYMSARDSFTTPKIDSTNQRKHDYSGALDFLKKRTNSFLDNIRNSKRWSSLRRKPDLESTRKPNRKSLTESHIESMISSLTMPNSPLSIDNCSSVQQKNKTHQKTIPTEVENFLENALGSELHTTTKITDSNYNASDLMTTCPTTEPPPKYSNIKLNRTLSAYKTLTQRIKKKFRKGILDEHDQTMPDLNPDDLNPELRNVVKELLDQVEIQQTLIHQASKALNLCYLKKEFISSQERVESERLLLLANLRKNACFDEIRRLVSLENHASQYWEKGDITIKDISLSLKEGPIRLEIQNGDFIEWFMVMVTQGSQVWSTQAVSCPIATSKLLFSKKIFLPQLKPDFNINIKVFYIKLLNSNHKEQSNTSCPSARHLLGRSDKVFTSPKKSDIRDSSLYLCGNLDIMLHDLKNKKPWPLQSVPSKSLLQGTIDLNINCKLQLTATHSGFLTYGEENCGSVMWNRCWCLLEKDKLLFWNYPKEQEFKSPLLSIDLTECISRRIGLADRTICAKPKTLLLKTQRKRSINDKDSIIVECKNDYTIIKNLLSCDTCDDLMEWQTKLNHVIAALREWNIIESIFEPQITDL